MVNWVESSFCCIRNNSSWILFRRVSGLVSYIWVNRLLEYTNSCCWDGRVDGSDCWEERRGRVALVEDGTNVRWKMMDLSYHPKSI